MKENNRETMQRAIGIIDGVSWVTEEKVAEALVSAMEMLDAILNDEEKGGNR
jgi:hypothetical protein